MALLELLGRRWTLRILWELRDGPLTSRALRAVAEISPSVLQARADELREAGMIKASRGQGYALTHLGQQLLDAFVPLYQFADTWAEAKAQLHT